VWYVVAFLAGMGAGMVLSWYLLLPVLIARLIEDSRKGSGK
jgi:hypothetical protein